ncbi:hypothetical protein Tco_0698104 [Tanacetum coccineum]
MPRGDPAQDPTLPGPLTRLLTGGQPSLTGGPTVVNGGGPPLTTVDWCSGDGSGDGDGTMPTPRGTTQVVTRGKLIIKITSLDRWQVRIRGTRYYSFGYEVAVWQWRLRGTVATRDPSQSLGSSRS